MDFIEGTATPTLGKDKMPTSLKVIKAFLLGN